MKQDPGSAKKHVSLRLLVVVVDVVVVVIGNATIEHGSVSALTIPQVPVIGVRSKVVDGRVSVDADDADAADAATAHCAGAGNHDDVGVTRVRRHGGRVGVARQGHVLGINDMKAMRTRVRVIARVNGGVQLRTAIWT